MPTLVPLHPGSPVTELQGVDYPGSKNRAFPEIERKIFWDADTVAASFSRSDASVYRSSSSRRCQPANFQCIINVVLSRSNS